jgi:hypothetical protein
MMIDLSLYDATYRSNRETSSRASALAAFLQEGLDSSVRFVDSLGQSLNCCEKVRLLSLEVLSVLLQLYPLLARLSLQRAWNWVVLDLAA